MSKPHLLLFWVFIVCSIATHPHIAFADNIHSKGVVDSFAITSTSGGLEFSAAGWVGADKPESGVMSLIVELGSDVIYEGHVERIERPDVVTATGRKDWLRSGWRINASIPTSIKNGEYDLHVRAKINDGTNVNLAVDNPQLKKLIINRVDVSHYQKSLFLFGVILAICSFYAVFMHGGMLAQAIGNKVGKPISPVTIAAVLVCFVFMGLVSLGITGSSLKILYDQTPFIDAKLDHVAFYAQDVRSDEWLVFTPMAIGQMNHQPQLPIYNRNLGLDGQNMLVVGMAGEPVNHMTAFAKPATWGFFLFDLKRALAWYWWFPLFGCLLALWWLFNLMMPGQWRLGFALSLLFCLSPYTVAWSNWPAYAVFFPTIALCSTLLLLRQKSWLWLGMLGALLGLSVAGFVLILYPPWQVTLGYLYLALALGLVIRDRSELSLDSRKIFAFGLATLLSGAILWSWWIDARPAIEAMLNTVYPGKRQLLVGGGMSLSDLLRGFSNIGALYKLEGGASNHSEIASFYYLFLPLIAAIGLRLRRSKGLWYVMTPIMAFMIFSLIYMIYGVPQFVSQITLWGRVPSQRADLALGLSYIFLCGLVFTKGKSIKNNIERTKLFAYITSVIWVMVVVYALSGLLNGALVGLTSGVKTALVFAIFMSGIWLILGDAKKFIAISLTICAATTITFNPIFFAPSEIDAATDVRNILGLSGEAGVHDKRVLVLGNPSPAMALVSAGIPIVNGTLYYPQMSLWQHLGVDKTLTDVINRYQHLIFVVGVVEPASGFIIELPSPDTVKVTVDAKKFNFYLTGANIVVAPQGHSKQLSHNPSLRLVRSNVGWTWFDVIKIDSHGE